MSTRVVEYLRWLQRRNKIIAVKVIPVYMDSYSDEIDGYVVRVYLTPKTSISQDMTVFDNLDFRRLKAEMFGVQVGRYFVQWFFESKQDAERFVSEIKKGLRIE